MQTAPPIPHKKIIFLKESDKNTQKVAELTFWFELYHAKKDGGLRFLARLVNINEGSIDKTPQNSVEIISGFDNPEKFILETTQEFLHRVEQTPTEFILKSKPLNPEETVVVLKKTEKPWIFDTAN